MDNENVIHTKKWRYYSDVRKMKFSGKIDGLRKYVK